MKKFSGIIIGLFISGLTWSQTVVQGTVTDKSGDPVAFANVIIKDSYDGATADEAGNFEFTTFEEGTQILMVKFVGYLPFEKEIDLASADTLTVDVVLKIDGEQLDPVVISAGAFQASDEKKAVVLKPLDIVTTAGGNGDIFGAIQTLPGNQTVGESEGLFVRGGSAAETKTIIDEMVVQNPFFSSVPDVPQRGRFSPFLFKGTVFSTGGYSAVYGQALSSALILNSVDQLDRNSTGLGILPIGVNVSHTRAFERTGVSVSGGYTHLGPYFQVINQLRDWEQPPVTYNGSLTLRHKVGDKGIFKYYNTYSTNELSLNFDDVSAPDGVGHFSLENQNIYINTSYKHFFNDKWTLFTGLSYAKDIDEMNQTYFDLTSDDQLTQTKVIATRKIGKRSAIKFGGEVHDQKVIARYDTNSGRLDELYSAAFLEGDIFISTRLAGRIGVRYENSEMIGEQNVAPRASIAYRTGAHSQMSLAYGKFFQTPETQYLFQDINLDYELADHYIANWQYMHKDRTFRIEAYDKEYFNLVTYDQDSLFSRSNFGNYGGGYARGVDVFFRDKRTIKNADYWISYSYLDTKRKFRNYPVAASPTFTSIHSLSVVYKHWIPKWRTSLGATFTYGSGRPYYNPNLPDEEFHSQRTPEYVDLSINFSKLTEIKGHFTVIFASVNNVLNRNNVFSYRYSPDGTQRVTVGPPQLRSFFVGVFISIDHDKKQETNETN